MPPIYGNIGSNSYDTLVPNALNNYSAMVGQRLGSWENSDQLFDRTIQGVLNRRAQVAAQKRQIHEQHKMFGKQLAITGGTALLAGGLTAGLGAIPATSAGAVGAADATADGTVASTAAATAPASIAGDTASAATADPMLTTLNNGFPTAGMMNDAAGMPASSFGSSGLPEGTIPGSVKSPGFQLGNSYHPGESLPGGIQGPSMPLPTSKIPQWNYAFGPTAGISAARGFGLGVLGVISPGSAALVAGSPAYSPLAAAHLGLAGAQLGLDTAKTAQIYDEINDPAKKALLQAHANYFNAEAQGLPDLRGAQVFKDYATGMNALGKGAGNGPDKYEPHSLQDLDYRQSNLQGDDYDKALGTLDLARSAYTGSGGSAQVANWGANQFYNMQKKGVLPLDAANPWTGAPNDGRYDWTYNQGAYDTARSHIQDLRKKRSSLNPGLAR